MVAGEGLRRFHALPAAAKPSGGDGRDRLRRAHHPIARMQLPDRQGRAHRGRHGSRMPPPEHVRQRRGRSDDERVRGPHGQDIRPDVGADSLSDGRLPPPAADRCGAGTHGGGLCRSGCVGDGQRRPQHPHRRREIHPRSPHRRRSVHRRGVDARKRHRLRRGAYRRGRQGLRLHRRREGAHRQRVDRRTLFRGRKLPAGQGLHGGRIALFRKLAPSRTTSRRC